MLKNILKSTANSFAFVICLSTFSPICAMSDDDKVNDAACSSTRYVSDSDDTDDYDRKYDLMYKRAKALELGRGVDKNLVEARKIYEELINGPTDVRASLRLGMLYGKDKNFKEAFKHYFEAWHGSGHSYEKAGINCAQLFERGVEINRNLPEALHIYRTIAATSQKAVYRADANYRVGYIMQFNPELTGRFKRSYKDAAYDGKKEAQFLMGCARKSRPDKAKAIYWFRKASEQGYLPAHLALFEMMVEGYIIGKNEEAAFNGFQRIYGAIKPEWTTFFKLNEPQSAQEAFQLFKSRINTGSIELILTNTYAGRNPREFVSLLRLACEKGHPAAFFTLGNVYEKGVCGIGPNPENAFELYFQAARRGHVEAKLKTADAYKHGRGTLKSFSRGFNWLKSAALSGHQEAIRKQQELFCFLLPESFRADYEGTHFNPHNHNILTILSLYSHPDFQQAFMTHWNSLLNSPNCEEMSDISLFILENYRMLEISEDSDFFLEVAAKRIISDNITDPKNPFNVWPALLQKRAVPVDVRNLIQDLPTWEIEGTQWRFNPARLEDFGKEVHIDQTTVPSVTQNDFSDALDKIQTKLTENPEAVQNAVDEITKIHNEGTPLPFEDLKTFALGYNGRSFFMNNLLKDSVEASQLKCVLNYIRSFSDGSEGPLSPQEEKLITFLMSVKACEIGQESGLTSYYQVYVPNHFKYSVTGDLFNHDRLEIQRSEYVFVSLMKEVINSILNTDNRFMKGICKTTGNVPQLSHQALYLKTLIGDKIGIPLCRFDPSTSCLSDSLLELPKADGLRHFYNYILTNECLVKEVENKINQAVLTGNTYLHLRDLTDKWTYKDDEDSTPQIKREGILELLIKIGLLEEGFAGSACSSSSQDELPKERSMEPVFSSRER
ncbi:MAG: sel1 repeat family protein [Alphaproteobacteria bacterium]|nr:sel1 repeat family protein [Alphaproteobacteria bacterium]